MSIEGGSNEDILSPINPVPIEAKDSFYKAFGSAMSCWGGIELSLMYLFNALMRPADPRCAQNVFRSGMNFKSQLEMVSVLVATAISDPSLIERWKVIKKRISTAQEGRNQMAHMHVYHMVRVDLFGKSPKIGLSDLPHEWAERSAHRGVVTTEKMASWEADFAEISRLIRGFEKEVVTSLHSVRKPTS